MELLFLDVGRVLLLKSRKNLCSFEIWMDIIDIGNLYKQWINEIIILGQIFLYSFEMWIIDKQWMDEIIILGCGKVEYLCVVYVRISSVFLEYDN